MNNNKFKNKNILANEIDINISDLKYLIILDFEANCSENNSVPLEIIEFPIKSNIYT